MAEPVNYHPGPLPDPDQQCAVVYFTRIGSRYGDGPFPAPSFGSILAAIANIGGSNIDLIWFKCGDPTPPDPNPINPPPTPPKPPETPPAPPPSPPPIPPWSGGGGNGGGDDFTDCCTAQLAILTTIAAELAAFQAKQSGNDKIDPCCARVIMGIANVTAQLAGIGKTLTTFAGSGPPTIDLGPIVIQLTSIAATLAALPAPVVNVTVQQPENGDPNIKRIADDLDTPPDAAGNLNALVDYFQSTGVFDADQAQLAKI